MLKKIYIQIFLKLLILVTLAFISNYVLALSYATVNGVTFTRSSGSFYTSCNTITGSGSATSISNCNNAVNAANAGGTVVSSVNDFASVYLGGTDRYSFTGATANTSYDLNFLCGSNSIAFPYSLNLTGSGLNLGSSSVALPLLNSGWQVCTIPIIATATSGSITINPSASVAVFLYSSIPWVTNASPVSTDATLSALTISSGTLSPTFASTTTSYTASVINTISSITVTPTRNEANATITVNGVAATSGSASGAIALSVGSNTVTTIVTAQNGSTTKTYTLSVTRAAANQSAFSVGASSTSILVNSGTAILTTSGGSGTGSVSYSVTAGTCSISGSTLTAGSSAGSCTVTATKAADATYNAATAIVTITVIAVPPRATIEQAASDPSVRSALMAQVNTMQRFTTIQIQNLSSHIEALRSNFRVTTGGLTLGVNQGITKDWMPLLDKLKEHYLAQENGSSKQEELVASTKNAMYLPDLSGEKDNHQNTVIKQTLVRHILLRNHAGLTDQNIERRLVGYRNQVRAKSANFGGLAEKFSEAEDGSVSQAGVLGWVSPGDLNSEFEQAMNQLKVGEVSKPVKTESGWHLIQVLERRQSELAVEKQHQLANLIKVSDSTNTKIQATLSDEGMVKKNPNTYGINDLLSAVYRGIAKDEEENVPTYALWSLGNFDFGTTGSNSASAPLKFSASGVTVGIDYQLHKSIIIGAAVGLGFDRTNIGVLGSNINSIQKTISTYGVYQPYKNIFLDGIMGYGSVGFNGNRIVTFDNSNTNLGISRTGNSLFSSLGVGYQLISGNFQYQPFARSTVTQFKLNPYSESGLSDYALAYGSATSLSTINSLGLKGMYEIFVDDSRWTPALKIMVSRNSSGSINQSAYYADTGAGGGTYYVSSVALPTYTESAGVSLKYSYRRNMSMELGYLGTIGNNSYRANSIKLDARLIF